MALFHTTVVDNQIKALDTIGTVSGSIATFNTDRAERLVSCVCEVASGASEINISACGINIYDEQWELGSLVWATGAEEPSTTTIRSKNYITVKPNTKVFCVGNSEGIVLYEYDINKAFVNRTNLPPNTPFELTTNANTRFLRWRSQTNDTTYANDISINYPSTYTQYHAYNGNAYNIPFGETLSGTATYDAISGVLTRNDSTTKQLDSCNIVALDNETNNVFCDTGDTEVNYIMTVGKAIS